MAPDWRRALLRLRHGPERPGDPVILMYHRVATPAHDPWELAVSPTRFAAQVEALTQRRRVVPLDWLARELAEGRTPQGVAAITFDDAYLDVLDNGAPVLERFGAPATLYVPTGLLGRPGEFWWDALARLILGAPTLPPRLIVDPKAPPIDAGGDRRAVMLAVWKALRVYSDRDIQNHLTSLSQQFAGVPSPDAQSRPMTAEQVSRLAAGGLVQMGAHTRTHASLPRLDAAAAEREIVDSVAALREITGKSPSGFAYPFGDHDAASVAAVRRAGLAHATTTRHGRARAGSHPLRLPRVAVGDWDAPTFVRRALGDAA